MHLNVADGIPKMRQRTTRFAGNGFLVQPNRKRHEVRKNINVRRRTKGFRKHENARHVARHRDVRVAMTAGQLNQIPRAPVETIKRKMRKILASQKDKIAITRNEFVDGTIEIGKQDPGRPCLDIVDLETHGVGLIARSQHGQVGQV